MAVVVVIIPVIAGQRAPPDTKAADTVTIEYARRASLQPATSDCTNSNALRYVSGWQRVNNAIVIIVTTSQISLRLKRRDNR
jgi:hypothetical protein